VPRPGAAVIPAMLTDYFETKYRISGSGLAYQIGSLIIGIIVSFLVPLLITSQGGAIGAVPYVAALYLMISVASLLVTVFYLKDIRDLPA
jgi:Fe2+ transport system protein B